MREASSEKRFLLEGLEMTRSKFLRLRGSKDGSLPAQEQIERIPLCQPLQLQLLPTPPPQELQIPLLPVYAVDF